MDKDDIMWSKSVTKEHILFSRVKQKLNKNNLCSFYIPVTNKSAVCSLIISLACEFVQQHTKNK